MGLWKELKQAHQSVGTRYRRCLTPGVAWPWRHRVAACAVMTVPAMEAVLAPGGDGSYPRAADDNELRCRAWVGHASDKSAFEWARADYKFRRELRRILWGSDKEPGLVAILARKGELEKASFENGVSMLLSESRNMPLRSWGPAELDGWQAALELGLELGTRRGGPLGHPGETFLLEPTPGAGVVQGGFAISDCDEETGCSTVRAPICVADDCCDLGDDALEDFAGGRASPRAPDCSCGNWTRGPSRAKIDVSKTHGKPWPGEVMITGGGWGLR